MPLISEVTHHMALLPMLWLGVLAWHGHSRGVLWWTLAVVLGVSWLADTAAHWVDPWLVSALYPAAQALIFACVVLPSRALGRFAIIISLVSGLAVTWRGGPHPEILAHTVAWTGLVTMAWPHRAIRGPILVTFGLGWLAWLGYNFAPSWLTWGVFQSVRALGLGAFCWVTLPQRVRA